MTDGAVEQALERATGFLLGLRRPDGGFEGNLEAGLMFNVAAVVLGRAQGAALPEAEEARELELARYVLSTQRGDGLFEAWPGGARSAEATRLALLGLSRVRASSARLAAEPALQARLDEALRQGQEALRAGGGGTQEHPFLFGFRLFLSMVDERAHGEALLPDWRAPAPPPFVVTAVLKGRLWRELEDRCFPFITAVVPLVALLNRRLQRRSTVGRAVARALERVPLLDYRGRSARAVDELVEQLVAQQDASGAFFYSSAYTQLFALALEGVRGEVSAAGRARLDEALARARRYLDGSHLTLPSGGYARFLGSDLWDTVAVGLCGLTGPGALLEPRLLEEVAEYALAGQLDDGGWAFASRSPWTDADSTGWTLAYLGNLRRRGLCPGLHPRLDAAVARGVDFLLEVQSDCGGFGAWGKSALGKRPGTVGALESIFLDLPTEDVTSRVLLGLGHLRRLYRADGAFAAALGEARHRRMLAATARALDFVHRQADPGHGLWPGRWTLGYYSGTAFVLAGLAHHQRALRPGARAVLGRTVLAHQNADGGFGESADTDLAGRFLPCEPSTTLHTVAALMVLADCGLSREPGFERAVEWLVRHQLPLGNWPEASVYTCFSGLYYRYEIMTQTAAIGLLGRLGPAQAPRRRRR